MRLVYKALSPDGKTLKGYIEAKSPSEAAAFLRTKHFFPIAISEKKPSDFERLFPFLHKVGLTELVFFTRELSSMFSSGLTLIQSLRILREQVENEALKSVIGGIIADVEEGKSLADAIAKYPDIFSSVYISLIRAAEGSGLLDKVLQRLADNLEQQQKLRSEIKSTLMYPVIVIVGMIAVMAIMMIFVVPQLTLLYENLDVPLPLPTQIVMGLSKFLVQFWPLILAGVAVGLLFYRRWSKTPSGKLIMDKFWLKVPIIGKLIQEKILTEFTRTFGLLIGSGTLVVPSLQESAGVVGNIHFQNAAIGVARKVEKGISVGDAMGSYLVYPPILVQMAKIGEETGKLDESMLKVADYFEREVEQTIKTLSTVMEPVLMIILGTGVAFLIISVISPIYNLVNLIQ